MKVRGEIHCPAPFFLWRGSPNRAYSVSLLTFLDHTQLDSTVELLRTSRQSTLHRSYYVHNTLQATMYTIHYKLLCTQYTTSYYVHNTLQATTYTIQYKLIRTQYTTSYYVHNTIQATMYTIQYKLLRTQYTTSYYVHNTLQATMYTIHYKLLCTQYTTSYYVHNTLQATTYIIHYKLLCTQYTTFTKQTSMASARFELSIPAISGPKP
jgi:hypothetical protein